VVRKETRKLLVCNVIDVIFKKIYKYVGFFSRQMKYIIMNGK